MGVGLARLRLAEEPRPAVHPGEACVQASTVRRRSGTGKAMSRQNVVGVGRHGILQNPPSFLKDSARSI